MQKLFTTLVGMIQDRNSDPDPREDIEDTVNEINAFMINHNLLTRATFIEEDDNEEDEDYCRVQLSAHPNDGPNHNDILELATDFLVCPFYDDKELYMNKMSEVNELLSAHDFPYVLVPYYKAIGYARRVNSNLK
jgi:hypothetical protein